MCTENCQCATPCENCSCEKTGVEHVLVFEVPGPVKYKIPKQYVPGMGGRKAMEYRDPFENASGKMVPEHWQNGAKVSLVKGQSIIVNRFFYGNEKREITENDFGKTFSFRMVIMKKVFHDKGLEYLYFDLFLVDEPALYTVKFSPRSEIDREDCAFDTIPLPGAETHCVSLREIPYHNYVCDNCGTEFCLAKPIKEGLEPLCDHCRPASEPQKNKRREAEQENMNQPLISPEMLARLGMIDLTKKK